MHVFEDRFFFFLNSVIKTNTINLHEKFLQHPKNTVNISVLIILYIILYIVFLCTIININYKMWFAYNEISYKLSSYINIICIVIFIILGMSNTKVSIF